MTEGNPKSTELERWLSDSPLHRPNLQVAHLEKRRQTVRRGKWEIAVARLELFEHWERSENQEPSENQDLFLFEETVN